MKTRLPLVAVCLIGVILLLPIHVSHGLYVVNLSSNVIFADDFENYTQGQKLGCSATSMNGQGGSQLSDGWGFKDCNPGGYSGINNTAYYSCCKSLWLRTHNSGVGAFDIDKRFFRPSNATTTIQVSLWYAMSANFVNETGNGIHIALEVFTQQNHLEAITRIVSHVAGPNAPACPNPPSGVGWIKAANQYSGSPSGISNLETSTDVPGYCHPTYEQPNVLGDAGDRRAVWSHIVMVVNVIKYQWVRLELNGFDYTKAVCPDTCRYMQIHSTNNTWASFTPSPIRLELGLENAATHIVASDTWYAWFDDLQITDATPGQPNIIQFGIVASSGLFQLILITTAMMYVSSGFGTVMRVFAKEKVPKFLGPKFIIITGVVGTAGFLFMLIVGANLVQPACPTGFTCSG